jgi:hypothetical protein
MDYLKPHQSACCQIKIIYVHMMMQNRQTVNPRGVYTTCSAPGMIITIRFDKIAMRA